MGRSVPVMPDYSAATSFLIGHCAVASEWLIGREEECTVANVGEGRERASKKVRSSRSENPNRRN